MRPLTTEYQSVSGAVDTGTTPSVQYAYTEMSSGQNNSRLVSMTYPNGRVLNYNYAAGLDSSISRLSSISDNSGILEAYVYLGLGTVVERDHPQTGVNETFISQTNSNGDAGDNITGLDRFGRIVEDAWYDTQTASFTDDFLYTFDRDSNVLTRTNALDAAFSQTYTYNGLNELTGYTQGNGQSQNFGLDALGNFTSVTTNGNPQTRTVNAQNQYTAIGSGTPTYDANGNLTTDPTTGNTMVYDAWNRLVSVKNGSTTLASYQFDALGRRIVEAAGSTSRDVYFDGSNAVEERLNGSPSASMQYVWDPLASNTLVEIDQGSNRYYVQQDANGNVTALVDTLGSVVERYVYDPYGGVTIYDPTWSTVRSSSSFDMRVLFQGMRVDPVVGLYHSGARDYSTTMLGWLQVDPIGFAGGAFVQTQFVGDNPVGRTDPSGLRVVILLTRVKLGYYHAGLIVYDPITGEVVTYGGGGPVSVSNPPSGTPNPIPIRREWAEMVPGVIPPKSTRVPPELGGTKVWTPVTAAQFLREVERVAKEEKNPRFLLFDSALRCPYKTFDQEVKALGRVDNTWVVLANWATAVIP